MKEVEPDYVIVTIGVILGAITNVCFDYKIQSVQMVLLGLAGTMILGIFYDALKLRKESFSLQQFLSDAKKRIFFALIMISFLMITMLDYNRLGEIIFDWFN